MAQLTQWEVTSFLLDLLWSPEPGKVSPRTAQCALQLAASSGRFSSLSSFSCGGKETTDSWESPPWIPGLERLSAHQTDGN